MQEKIIRTRRKNRIIIKRRKLPPDALDLKGLINIRIYFHPRCVVDLNFCWNATGVSWIHNFYFNTKIRCNILHLKTTLVREKASLR